MPNEMERKADLSVLSREEQFEKLLKAYDYYYDITRDLQVGDIVFPAMAEFHSRSEKYLLVRKAKIWGMEMNEYVYFLLADVLAPQQLAHVIELAREDGLSRIHPHSEHMYSHVSLSVIAQQIPDETEQLIRSCRFHKNFRLSLHGWMEFRIAALDRSNGQVICNRAGRDVRKTLEQNLAPKIRERRKNK